MLLQINHILLFIWYDLFNPWHSKSISFSELGIHVSSLQNISLIPSRNLLFPSENCIFTSQHASKWKLKCFVILRAGVFSKQKVNSREKKSFVCVFHKCPSRIYLSCLLLRACSGFFFFFISILQYKMGWIGFSPSKNICM
jgi:hypothetical protein